MADPQADDERPFRYDARAAGEFETRWQAYWRDHGTWNAPNPSGPLRDGWDEAVERPKRFILDMFPYPSGSGLHVGHPLGYIATDVYGRYLRMRGFNVLHTIGYDAFGLPAEQYAVETGRHPRATTEANVANYRRQLGRLGLAHDTRRAVSTTDPAFVRWTQWIFLQVYNAYFDIAANKARPVTELITSFEDGSRPTPDGVASWADLSATERRRLVDDHRLVYRAEAMVNWCPGLGTVLANEEVTADGRSDRGNFPVYRRPLTQWMMRITAYSDRLLDDLAGLDWPEPVKHMQRNWIGRSLGAHVDFGTDAGPMRVFTTRPDTLFGATFMVVAPEHPMVDALLPDDAWPEGTDERWTGGAATPRDAVNAYRAATERVSEMDRQADTRDKTGVFIGAHAVNPVNDERIPIFMADYVLAGYGTGAIMAVPAQDDRDWEFAIKFGLSIVRTVAVPDGFDGAAYLGDGPAINSGFLDGMGVAEAKASMIAWLEERGAGEGAVTTKLRDWLFSRQRYWGEPFPIVYDEAGLPHALPESMLPVDLPELDDFAPRSHPDDPNADPEPPLGRVEHWVNVELDLGRGDGPRRYVRETNTMPQWAGSCWYYLRYLDPTNENAFVDPAVEQYWMGSAGKPGGVDLYVGGVEHAVLHLLYSRFWHKVLFDLGHVSTPEPFQRLFNQGMIQAAAFKDEREMYVDAADVIDHGDGTFTHDGEPVRREFGKMGKSLKNGVTPDEIYASFGADTLRVYEMAMGPLDVSRPWRSDDIVGAHRLLQRVWRAIVDDGSGELRVVDAPVAPDTRRLLHRTIAAVGEDYDALRFNTAVARITELVNHVTKAGLCERATGEALTLLLAPLAPHIGEELWSRLGHQPSIGYAPFPAADPAELVDATVTLVVQINGKVRDRVEVAADADAPTIEALALALPRVVELLDGATPRKVIVRPPSLVNVVV